LSEACRYDNCTHEEEPGCAVLEAVSDGSLDKMVYRNFLKLKREAKHYESTVADKRKADKEFGKMVKKAMKHKKGNKY
jgi:ribosome biogenesis GTPase